MNNITQKVGRARTVLVFGEGDAAKAVVCALVARTRRRSGRNRLSFTGAAGFGEDAARHLRQTVLGVAEGICQRLGVCPKYHDLSAVNLAAAASADLGVAISGFSADAAALLAILSAALKLPLPQDLVATAHVASTDGDLRPVASLPVKLAAAADDPGVCRLLTAPLAGDASLAELAPIQRAQIEDALADAKGRLAVADVCDVAELLATACEEEAVVRAALRSGFFDLEDPPDAGGSPLERAAAFLAGDNEGRFWRVLERHLLAGRSETAKELLQLRLRHQLRARRYPRHFGTKLMQLVASLPPATRRLKTAFPLIPMDQCLQLGRLASSDHLPDTQHLLDAARGKMLPVRDTVTRRASGHQVRHAEAAVDVAMDEISAEALAAKIGAPIDAARASYLMDEVTVDSYEAFQDAVAAYYLAMLRHTGAAPVEGGIEAIAAEAFSLLQRAFETQGGADAAWAEAQFGTSGGMRLVLDTLTEQYKTDRQSQHVERVLKEILDPLDWDARTAFMQALLERLGPHLPPDLRRQPPERFARHYPIILKTYVQSLDRVKQLLRNL